MKFDITVDSKQWVAITNKFQTQAQTQTQA